jgi:predicted RNase H-like nuclease (RuvC/YqgF family)
LKYSFENAEREISFYTNQINVFKSQLQNAALREQQLEVNNEKRLEYLNSQLKKQKQTIDSL